MSSAAVPRSLAVAHIEDVPLHEGRRVTIGGRAVAIFRTASGVHAVDASCPHAGGPLEDGLTGDNCVRCPLHGRLVDLRTGEVENCSGTVAVHTASDHGGWIYLELSQ